MHVTLQGAGQVKHLGFEALQDLRTMRGENGKSEGDTDKMALRREKSRGSSGLLLGSWGRPAEPLSASLWWQPDSAPVETGSLYWSPSAGT